MYDGSNGTAIREILHFIHDRKTGLELRQQLILPVPELHMTGMGGGFVGVHACFLKRYLELCLKWRTLHMFTAINVFSLGLPRFSRSPLEGYHLKSWSIPSLAQVKLGRLTIKIEMKVA